jgi:hypothetical protein
MERDARDTQNQIFNNLENKFNNYKNMQSLIQKFLNNTGGIK